MKKDDDKINIEEDYEINKKESIEIHSKLKKLGYDYVLEKLKKYDLPDPEKFAKELLSDEPPF
jgi:PP-loop superfamily ATP-utilizing enzyme